MANLSETNRTPSTIFTDLNHTASLATAVGDMLYWDFTAKSLKPASSFTDMGTEALTQRAFAACFIGKALNGQLASDSTGRNAKVLVDSIIDLTCTSSTFDIGDYVAPSYSGGILSATAVVKVTDPSRAIGKVAKKYTAATTTVRVQMFSPMFGGHRREMPNNAWVIQSPPGQVANEAGVALTIEGGAGGTGTSGTAGAGAALTLRGGQGAAATSGTGGAAGVTTIGGNPGGAITTGTVGGAGQKVALTGGAGGAASAGTGNGGAGGSIIATPGAGGATTGGTAGVDGGVFLRSSAGKIFFQQTAPTAETDANNAIAAADMINGIVVHTVSTGRTLTTPTGAQISAACPADLAVGDSFRLTVITVGTGADDISTLTAGDGNVTFVGKVTVGPDIADAGPPHGTWIFRNTGTNTWIGYRVG